MAGSPLTTLSERRADVNILVLEIGGWIEAFNDYRMTDDRSHLPFGPITQSRFLFLLFYDYLFFLLQCSGNSTVRTDRRGFGFHISASHAVCLFAAICLLQPVTLINRPAPPSNHHHQHALVRTF
jgi:hypothetical protein